MNVSGWSPAKYVFFTQRCVQGPMKHLRWSFLKNIERPWVVIYFGKKVHLRSLTDFWVCLVDQSKVTFRLVLWLTLKQEQLTLFPLKKYWSKCQSRFIYRSYHRTMNSPTTTYRRKAGDSDACRKLQEINYRCVLQTESKFQSNFRYRSLSREGNISWFAFK